MKEKNMLSPIKRKNKKGVSVVIGYILLISFAIIISTLVYQWLKSYIPKESLECPEGVSIFVKDYIYDCNAKTLSLTIKNNGKFDLAGYYIRASDSATKEVATIDLSDKIISGGEELVGSVTIVTKLKIETGNSFSPESSKNEKETVFDVSEWDRLYFVELVPTRFQEIGGKKKFLICSNAKIKEEISCAGEECVPDCEGRECGNDGCEGTCPPNDCENEGEVCNFLGQCVAPEDCEDTCASLGYDCGTWTICGVSKDCGLEIGCDPVTEICNEDTGQCEDKTYCGDGIITNPNDDGVEEECDGSPFPDNCIAPNEEDECTCDSSLGYIPDGSGGCYEDPTYGIEDYCVDLEIGYTFGICAINLGTCVSGGNPQGDDVSMRFCEVVEANQVACCQPKL
jgi:hypothetical protein